MRTVMIMEYSEGGSVLSMLDEPRYRYGLPETQLLLLLYHVAAGMQYLRHVGVVHRDIKPANIMRSLTEDGSSVYKLTDFGAARQLEDDENFTSMYGTEEYLHPEMYEKGVLRLPSQQQFDARMDLWSLGVTFYHVATGQLPFQAYGGRSNKQTMYHIISQKESGIISGQQQFEGGPIHWSRHLPPTCLLSSGVRQFLTPVLAGLMEANMSHVLSYEELFAAVQRLKSLVPLTVFDFLHSVRHRLLLESSCRLPDLQTAVAAVTEVPGCHQLLLLGGHAMEEVVDPLTPLAALPTHLLHAPLHLFPREVATSPLPSLPSPEIPPFPEFLDIVDLKNDPALALNCQSRGHLILRHTELIGQQQVCLVEGHLHLRMYVVGRLRAVEDSLQLVRQLVWESGKRFSAFYSNLRSVQDLLTALGQPPDAFLNDLLQDDTLLRVQKKTEERVEEILKYRQGVEERLRETRPHTVQWSEQCQHTECVSKVDHQLTVIGQILSRFRRDRHVSDSLTTRDENIHRLERQKLQDTCTRMLSILTGHCVPARDRLHRHALDWTGSLLKSLARVIKVEKNNESVTNCQRLLSARLDKLESKCRDEVEHLQKELMARFTRRQHLVGPWQHTKSTDLQPTSSADEGLGTSLLQSGSVTGSSGSSSSSSAFATSKSSSSSSSSPPVGQASPGHEKDLEAERGRVVGGERGGCLGAMPLETSLQSLRLEGEQVLCLLSENLDIMKRLQAQNMPADSRRSLFTIEEDSCSDLSKRPYTAM